MKTIMLIVFLFTVCLGSVRALSTDRIEINKYEIWLYGTEQDKTIIDAFNKQKSIREQISYLKQVLARPLGNSSNEVLQASAARTTAILLLGRVRTPEAFQLILKYIKHQDKKTNLYPAIWALKDFDSKYITSLVALIDKSPDGREQWIAVQALRELINTRGSYVDFLNEQGEHASPDLYRKLFNYSL